MNRKFKSILIVCLIFLSFLNLYIEVKADSSNMSKNKNILVIASYSYSNDWENTIIKGIKDYYGDKKNIKTEYLDSTAYLSKDYYSDFLDLINIKYSYDDIDYIITLDDEAFDFALTYLFDEESVCYKKYIFCLGLNNSVNLTDEQRRYVSGIVDTQNGRDFLEFVEATSPEVEKVYLLSDESAYCEAFKNSIMLGNERIDKKLNIYDIKSNYIEDICDQIREKDLDSSAFILSGTFYYKENENDVNAPSTISSIKSVSNNILYSTLENYIKEGAFGGLINDAYKLGQAGAQQLEAIIDNNIDYSPFNVVTNVFDICIVNYKVMRDYSINPFNLPENTIYLGKSKYDLLLPKYLIGIMEFISATLIITLIILVIAIIKHKRMEYSSRIKLLESKEREKIKTNFIIVMSHELRTPLNIILNTVKLLKTRIKDNNYEREYFLEKIDYIIVNSNRLLKSINNSIDVAKIESKVFDINFRMENIVEVIDEVVDVTAGFAKDNNIKMIFDPEEEVIETAIDREKIERILLNLISNSIKNIKDEGTIFIKCSRDKNNLYISVEDNGIGISDTEKEHIFEKFFQSYTDVFNRSYEGNGLGLYITKGLVDIHGGSIRVESSLGIGTTFYITIPIKIVDDEKADRNSYSKDINQLVSLEFSDVAEKKK